MYDDNAQSKAATIIKYAISYINAGGMIIGIIAANLADVVFGGIMLSIILKDVDAVFGPPVDGWFFGMLISFALWFIQMLLWKIILNDKEITTADIAPIILAVVVAFVDTNMDTSPVLMWVEGSTIKDVLSGIAILKTSLYEIVKWSIVIGIYITNGCTELFNSWYLRNITTQRFATNSTKSQRRALPQRPTLPQQPNSYAGHTNRPQRPIPTAQDIP